MVDFLIKFYLNNMLLLNVVFATCILLIFILYMFYKDEIKALYLKYKELINYVIVGVLTTVVSIGSYWLFRFIFNNYIVLSIISWVLSVAFAYFTNRLFVFESKDKNIFNEITKFVGSRLFTLCLEILLMFVFVSLFKINDMISKIILQFIILVTNYLLSKLFVFKKKVS